MEIMVNMIAGSDLGAKKGDQSNAAAFQTELRFCNCKPLGTVAVPQTQLRAHSRMDSRSTYRSECFLFLFFIKYMMIPKNYFFLSKFKKIIL